MSKFKKFVLPKPDPNNQKEKDLYAVLGEMIFALDAILNNPDGWTIGTLKKLYLDDGDDDYISSPYDGRVNTYADGNIRLIVDKDSVIVNATDLVVDSTKKLYLDSGGDTYFTHPASNQVVLYVGGSANFWHYASQSGSKHDFALEAGKKLFFDGGTDTYIYEQSDGNLYVMANGNHRISFTADKTVLLDKMTPANTAAADLGDEVYMFNEVHCVQVVDYSRKNPKDNPLNAIRKIKHEDKTTYPSDVYIPAKEAESDCEVKGKRFKKGEKIGNDGTKILQMIPYLVDSIKELADKVEDLEKEITKLKNK